MKYLLPLILLAGCGETFSNAPLEDDGRFLAAAPSAARLRLSVGSADGVLRQALTEEPAEFYVFTRQTVLSLNSVGFNLLRGVDRLVEDAPTERGADFRAWTATAQGLEPHDHRFEMTRVDGAFDFRLDQDTVPIITGNFDARGGAGALTFDLDAVADLNASPVRGKLLVDYAIDGRAVDLAIQFEGFAALGDARDSRYRFQREDDGAGTFDFEFETAQGALVHVRSRWLADGRGRADARVMGEGDDSVISECWGENFAQSYYRAADNTAGDEASCAFADVSLPE